MINTFLSNEKIDKLSFENFTNRLKTRDRKYSSIHNFALHAVHSAAQLRLTDVGKIFCARFR